MATGTEEQTGEALGGPLFSDVFRDVGPDGGLGVGVNVNDALARTAGLSSEVRYGLLCFDVCDNVSRRCLARVGKNGRMCIKIDCTTGAHRMPNAKVTFPDDSGPCVFILGQSAAPDEASTVHAEPYVPLSVFSGNSWEETWVDSIRKLATWQTVFASLTDAPSDVFPAAMTDLHERSDRNVTFAVTPRKRTLQRATIDEYPGDFEVEAQAPMIEDLGPTNDLMLSNLGPAWKTLSTNLASLSRVAQAAHSRTTLQGDEAGHELDRIDVKLSHLHTLLGDRPTSMGTRSIFEALTSLLDEMDLLRSGTDKIVADAVDTLKASLFQSLSQLLGKAVAFEVQSQVQSEVRSQVQLQVQSQLGNFVETEFQARVSKLVSTEVSAKVFSPQSAFHQKFIVPTAALLGKCSPSMDQPGATWQNRIDELERSVQRLEDVKPSRGPFNPAGSEAFDFEGLFDTKASLSSPKTETAFGDRLLRAEQSLATLLTERVERPPGVPPNASLHPIAQDSQVNLRINALSRELSEVRNALRNSSVTIDGMTFDAPGDVRSWMIKHGVTDLAHLFVDPISLLALSDTVAKSEYEAAKTREMSHKVKDSCVEMTKYKASYHVEVPPILGKGVNESTTSADRALAAVPTYHDWDNHSSYDGVHDRMKRLLHSGTGDLKFRIDSTFHDKAEAKSLATSMRLLSLAAWQTIGTWMSSFYAEVLTRSRAKESECWILVTHCVRKILTEARQARLPGASGEPHDMLWGALQAHAFFTDLLAHNIYGHPKISVIIQSHQVDHSTPVSSFLELKSQVEALTKLLSKEVSAAKKTADAALTHSKKGKGPKGADDG